MPVLPHPPSDLESGPKHIQNRAKVVNERSGVIEEERKKRKYCRRRKKSKNSGPLLVWKLRAGLSGMVVPAGVKKENHPAAVPKPIIATRKPPTPSKWYSIGEGGG